MSSLTPKSSNLACDPHKKIGPNRQQPKMFWPVENFTPHRTSPLPAANINTRSGASQHGHETPGSHLTRRNRNTNQSISIRNHGRLRKAHQDKNPASHSVSVPPSLTLVPRQFTDPFPATSTRSRPTSCPPGTCSCSRRPRPPRTCPAWAATTASSAPSGSRPSRAWSCTGRASRTRGGQFPVALVLLRPVRFLTAVCRLKQLREGPYTHEEANAAVSYRIDNGPERTKTQEVEMS